MLGEIASACAKKDKTPTSNDVVFFHFLFALDFFAMCVYLLASCLQTKTLVRVEEGEIVTLSS